VTDRGPTAVTRSRDRRVEDFVQQMVVGVLNLEMHSASSPHIEDNLTRMVDELEGVCRAIAPQPLRIDLGDDYISFRGRHLVRASLQAGKLLRQCKARDITALTFERHTDRRELLVLLQLLGDESTASADANRNLWPSLSRHGLRRISVDTAAASPATLSDSVEERAVQQYQQMADLLQESHVNAFRGANLRTDDVATVVERALGHLHGDASSLMALAMSEQLDSFTVAHSVRVTLLALQVARAASATPEQLMKIGTAALLHDIGKSRVPQDVLFKAGSLDPEERHLMSQHARLGGEVLLEQPNLEPTAVGAAFSHHMGPRGLGYPKPLLPFTPSGVSQLVRVCDVFEALTAKRPYKPPLAPFHAYVLMHRMRDSFYTPWFHFFIKTIGLFPVGSTVTLEDGEEAVVVGPGPNLDQPLVRVDTAASGDNGRVRKIAAVTSGHSKLCLPADLVLPCCLDGHVQGLTPD